jgi:hypothetical protein
LITHTVVVKVKLLVVVTQLIQTVDQKAALAAARRQATNLSSVVVDRTRVARSIE